MTEKRKRGRPRKVRDVGAIAVPGPDGLSASPDDDVNDAGQTENLFDVSGDETVRVERQSERTGRYEFHGYVPDASESRLAELFGGGRYRVKLIVPDATGRRVIQKTRELIIPGVYKPPESLPGITAANTSQTAKPTGGTAGTVIMDRPMSLNETLNTALVSQVLEVMKSSKEVAGPRVDWSVILPSVMSLVGTVAEALVNRPSRESPEAAALREQLAEVRRELLALRDKPGPASSGIADAVEAIKSLMEVRDMIGGGEGKGAHPEDAMWSLGAKALELLGKAAVVPPAGPVPVPPGAPAPSAGTEATTSPPGPSLPAWQRLLLHYRAQLVEVARRGLAPGFAAEVAVNFMPDNLHGIAVEFVRRPDAAAIAVQVIPELADFPTWNTEFWEQARALLVEDEDSPEAEVVADDDGDDDMA